MNKVRTLTADICQVWPSSHYYAVQFFHHIDSAFIRLPILVDQLPDDCRSAFERFHPVQHVGNAFVCLFIRNGSLLLNVFKIHAENLFLVSWTEVISSFLK